MGDAEAIPAVAAPTILPVTPFFVCAPRRTATQLPQTLLLLEQRGKVGAPPRRQLRLQVSSCAEAGRTLARRHCVQRAVGGLARPLPALQTTWASNAAPHTTVPTTILITHSYG
jgi:hypothetical protein